ncbi:carbohydrate ABC transporter permease [Microbacterium sp. TNHR37B]|uniref:carbohydrate ABC transporter permease n=1 Tax=Microbacterium sp. TNHR37B TaxID=1775956 RepID=UPI0007B18ADF|nr:sugar ABC transporter permease [Microbacterium sp. TNHR37B]KZE91546.1 Lactose transport system permease protein LacF [Microbacterium sp. TNHR37B]
MSSLPDTRPRRRLPGAVWVLILPFVIMFTAFFVAPIVYALVQSMFATRSSGLGFGAPETTFVFVDNYARALSDPTFVESLGRLVTFSAILVPLMVLTALALALLLDSGRALAPRFFRVVFFSPYGVPGVVATLLWGFLYVPATSPVLQVLSSMGLRVDPLSSGSVLFSIANIALWGFAGYNMVILMAALNAIPSELYEAARVDGASAWSTIWHIKLPLVRPSIILVTVFTIIGTLQLFVEPLVLKPLTTAISSTYTPNLAAYNQAFAQGNPNLAAAMAVIVAVLGFVFSFGFLRLVNRKDSRAW